MRNFLIAVCFAVIVISSSCSKAGRNNPGTEYMPDMYHSIAYEANLEDYYYYNTWGTESEYYKFAQPRKPVKGTMPRGASASSSKYFNGMASNNAIAVPASGHVPYYYSDTEEERTRATMEIIKNPLPISEAGLAEGKLLYETFCGVCHGAKGDGNGWLVDEANPNAVYPAAPANLISDEFINSSNGRFYHGIMYGKNVMGGYADKISYEERWNVIHYIRSLQAKSNGTEYNAGSNTLNAIDVPQSKFKQVAQHHDGGHHGDMHHGSDHEGGVHHGTEQHSGEHHGTLEHGTEHQGGDHHGGGTHQEGDHEHSSGDHSDLGKEGTLKLGKKKKKLGEKIKDGVQKVLKKKDKGGNDK